MIGGFSREALCLIACASFVVRELIAVVRTGCKRRPGSYGGELFCSGRKRPWAEVRS
ncbi:hypothetical protein METH_07605 [Leisingera methylohalidivorans DSM 14336]|uniref:Uncharacterized protein n=1 Tax=Leisingera methylohalidivorans DSM 14336 TaxID=999552 RepID=V9VW51_9RHOB|nr:hypothetical protein METH_07605 [Leisingera methylohalidivorans DSM 14336]